MNMDYKEKLKDPRWISRRKEIMERDNHRCMICHCDQYLLNVHHLHYRKGVEPWEYNDFELVTLCEHCHKMVHDNNLELEVRRSKISSRYMLGLKSDDDYFIQTGTILASDFNDLIFVCADKPFLEYFVMSEYDGSRADPMTYPIQNEVETLISVNKDGSNLAFNEYCLPIDGVMSVDPRPATDEEKMVLAKALKEFLNL